MFGRSDAIRSLEERVAKLERTLSGIELDWSDTYDKLKRLVGRYAKERSKIESLQQNDPVDGAGDAGSTAPAPHSLLTPRQHQIQQQILQRRVRM